MEKEYESDLDAALAAGCPQIYANGFALGLGIGDVLVALQQNGKPVANINLSFTVAKTLCIKLGTMIHELEQKTSQTIMTTDDILTLTKDNSETH